MATLQVLNGHNPGQLFPLDREKIALGRHADNDIVLDVGPVSRQHAQILRIANEYFIEDLKSRNGTHVNGSRIAAREKLQHGDRIQLCKLVFQFHHDTMPPLVTPPPVVILDQATETERIITRMKVNAITPLIIAGGLTIPDYLSPDQIDERPGRPIAPTTDLHALGIMMYEMLLGQSPLPERLFEKLRTIATRQFPSAVERCTERGFPLKLATLIDACLAGKYLDVDQFRQGMNSIRTSWSPEARPRLGPHRSAQVRPGERLQVVRLLFEDVVSEAFEVEGTQSLNRATIRLFKPSFHAPPYLEMIQSLVTNEQALEADVPRELLRRLAAGRARPLPVQLGAQMELDRNMSSDGCPCLLEEYVGNQTLHTLIGSGEPVGNESRIAGIVDQILNGLKYAHDQACIHENLTPYCIFLDPDDAVKVEGFGLHAQVEQLRMKRGGDSSIVSSSIRGLRVTVNPEVKLRAMMEITRNLANSTGLDEVLPKILDSLFKVFVQADRAFIVLRDSLEGPLIPKAVKYRRDEHDDTIRISKSVVNTAMSTREALLSADAASDSRFQISESIADFRIRSLMCAPLIDSGGKALGVIQIDTLDQRSRFTQDDLDVLCSAAAQSAFAIEVAQLHETTSRQKSLERDLQLAHKVQNGLLPKGAPDLAGYDFFVFYEPANQIGGDYYDYIRLSDDRLAVIVADVSGKGIAAALLMAKVSAEAQHCLAIEPSPAAAICRLNRIFARNGWEDRFVTVLLAVIDSRSHKVTLVNAGAIAPLVLRSNKTIEEPGDAEAGVPLGVAAEFPFEECSFEIAPGECLALFTDGISEAIGASGDLYGLERIQTQMLSNFKSVGELGQLILADLKHFVGTTPQYDDQCLIVFGRTCDRASP